MNMLVRPARLQGSVTPPPSKSQAHRVIIAAALAPEESTISNVDASQDILATQRCLDAIGTPSPGLPLLDCGESGSTLRFLLPLALVLRGGGVFTGQGRLMERPMQPYADICALQGIAFTQKNGVCTVRGILKPDTFSIAGDVSSQFITGLLYALPLLDGDSEIMLTTPLESAGYVDMTLETLRQFGISVSFDGDKTFVVPGSQQYKPAHVVVEPDYSQAAFYCAARGIGNCLELMHLNPDSVQGDRIILAYAQALGQAGEVVLDVSQCPDLVPPLALQAAVRQGQITRLINAGRLRIKESDRLDTVTTELNRLGARVEQTSDSLIIRGVDMLHGGVTAQSHNDHRIAMMLGIAATRADAPFVITGADCVSKSYPGFWKDYVSLGGLCEEVTACIT